MQKCPKATPTRPLRVKCAAPISWKGQDHCSMQDQCACTRKKQPIGTETLAYRRTNTVSDLACRLSNSSITGSVMISQSCLVLNLSVCPLDGTDTPASCLSSGTGPSASSTASRLRSLQQKSGEKARTGAAPCKRREGDACRLLILLLQPPELADNFTGRWKLGKHSRQLLITISINISAPASETGSQ